MAKRKKVPKYRAMTELYKITGPKPFPKLKLKKRKKRAFKLKKQLKIKK